jgi:hypothetical protein
MKEANVIGRKVAWLRNQRGSSQNDLVTHLHLLGDINLTREKIANIETLRRAVDSKKIKLLAQMCGRRAQALVPTSRTAFHFVCLARPKTDKQTYK